VPDRGYVLYVRGDASRGAAERVTEDRIIGRVVSLQRKGRTIAVASPLRRCLGLGWARYQNMRSTVRVYLGQWRRSVTVRS
jgi:hypothetical protein